MLRVRASSVVLAFGLSAAGVVACSGTATPACARSSGASKSGGAAAPSPGGGGKAGGVAPPPKAPPPAPKAPDPPPYRPPPPGAPLKPENRPPPPKPPPARSPQQQERARGAASSPKARPDPQDIDDARSTAPQRVTRGGSYHSSVTNNTYVYQEPGFFSRPGYLIDVWNPYDPWNYWARPWSPFYGRPFIVAAGCDGKDEHVEQQPQNVTVNVDTDGKVIDTKDASPATEPGTTPATAVGTVPS